MKVYFVRDEIKGVVNGPKGVYQVPDPRRYVFNCVEVDDCKLPDDYVNGKYLFKNGEFVPNPRYVAPPEELIKKQEAKIASQEERISQLESQIEELTLALLSSGGS